MGGPPRPIPARQSKVKDMLALRGVDAEGLLLRLRRIGCDKVEDEPGSAQRDVRMLHADKEIVSAADGGLAAGYDDPPGSSTPVKYSEIRLKESASCHPGQTRTNSTSAARAERQRPTASTAADRLRMDGKRNP